MLDREGADDVNRPGGKIGPFRTRSTGGAVSRRKQRTLDAETPGRRGRYRADDRAGKVVFSMPVQKGYGVHRIFCGPSVCRVRMEADDADLFVYVVKQDETGRLLPPVVKVRRSAGKKGAEMFIPNGRLQVSGARS